MSIIPCANNCTYQNDGYCNLETIAAVSNVDGGCPHYTSRDNKPYGTAHPIIANKKTEGETPTVIG